MFDNLKALKLDSSYRPIQIIGVFEAFCMIYTGRANLVERYDDLKLKSTNETFSVPCVIALNRYVNRDKISLKCNRKNVFWRDRNTCQYCAQVFPESSLTLDHVTPRSKGGPKTWENIVTACRECNQVKGDKLPYEAGMQPLRQPKEPSSYTFRLLEKRKEINKKWLPYLER